MSGTKKHIKLRAIEPEDIDLLYEWENDESHWEVSNTHLPFSKAILSEYIKNAQTDIYTAGQLRLVIQLESEKKAIGFVDLFDFDPFHQRAGIGILISKAYRQQSYATIALQEIIDYGFNHLGLHQLYCNITPDNTASIRLFESLGFSLCGTKKDWIRTTEGFKDEFMYQVVRGLKFEV